MARILARGQLTVAAINDGTSVKVKSTSVAYQLSTSGTAVPTGTWSGIVVAATDAQPYLWTRTVVTYSDGNSTTTYSVAYKGKDGNNGLSLVNGRSMFKDLLFDEGNNGCVVYNNKENGTVTVTRVAKSSDNPYANAKYELEVKTTGEATPYLGGTMQIFYSRPNAVFVRRVIAKIPKGYSLVNAENAMGDGRTIKWLTPTVGTGVFTEYMYMYICGATGSFASAGHMYLTGPAATADNPVTWRVASCETYDMTAGSSAVVKSTAVEYAVSSSGTAAPSGGWGKSVPSVPQGQYLWTRTVMTYMDGSSVTSYSVSKMGLNYWRKDEWLDLSDAQYDQDIWYPVVGTTLPVDGYAGIKVVVFLNSGTIPSWSTHSTGGFAVDFHIDTQSSGWGTTLADTIIYSDNCNWVKNNISPVSYGQMTYSSLPVLYLRGGGKYRVIATYDVTWEIYKETFTLSGQSVSPQTSRPTLYGRTLKGDTGEKGDKGDAGAAGKDAVQIGLSPTALTLSAVSDASGNATADCSTGNEAQVTVTRGTEAVTGYCTFAVSAVDGCTAKIDNRGTGNVWVVVSAVAADTVDGRKISRTSASVTVKAHCSLTNTDYYATLTVNVSVSAVWGGLQTDMKGLKTEYNEISNTVDSLGATTTDLENAVEALPLKTQDELTRYTSKIEQTARDISLKVSATAVGRKNLLVGSALRKQGEGVDLRGGTGISVVNQYGGINSVTCTGSSMPGLQWKYEKGVSPNIKVEKGKTYTISVMARATSESAIYIEGYYTSGQDTTDRPTGAGSGGSAALLNPSVNTQWQLYQRTFTVAADSLYEWLHVAIMGQITNGATVYLCQPMLVEGDEYAGWSLSEDDAEYIGGNLLDNTDTLVQGGNLIAVNGGLNTDTNSYKGNPTLNADCRYSDGAVNIAEWNLSGVIERGQDYMLSFWGKGNKDGVMAAYLYGTDGASVAVEKCDSYGWNATTNADGYAPMTFAENYVWRRYWVHWRVESTAGPYKVMLRCAKGCDMYISQPKLEKGATMTEWRATATDYTEDRSVEGRLLDTGIDINSKRITLTADNTIFRTRTGKEVAIVDEEGIKAASISTVTNGSKAGVEISEGLARFFGDAGVCNIRIGVDASGMAVLSYYDNNGTLLYDLGPSGLDTKGMTSAKLEKVTLCRVSDVLGSAYRADWTLQNQVPDGDVYAVVSSAAVQKKLFNTDYTGVWKENSAETLAVLNHKPTSGVTRVTLYRYTAARVQSAYVADSARGLTAAMAAQANGKYFTSETIASGGALTNIASGEYLKPDTQPRSYAMGYEAGYPRFALEPFFAINGGVSEMFVVYSMTNRKADTDN